MGIIGTIRKHSWVAVAIVGIAIVAFIIGDLTKNNGGIPDMGKINGTTITAQHFNTRLAELEDNYKRQQGLSQIPSDVEYQLREQLWQSLVDETVFGEQYEAIGLRVSDRELSDMYGGTFVHPYVRQMFTNPQTGQFDAAQVRYIIDNFDQIDSNMRHQWVEMEKMVREDRQMQKYGQLIAQGFYMPTPIADQIAAMSSRLGTVAVVSLPYSDMPDAEAVPAEQDYQTYYNQHKAEFRVSEELRDLDMIVFNVVPTPEDLQTIQDEVMTVWDSFQVTETIEIPYFVNSESDHSYDSTYIKTSSLSPALDSVVSRLGAGQYVTPRIIGNEWVMAKVLSTDVRPDSLRASSIIILNEKAGGNITRNDADAKNLADSIAAQLRAGRMQFEAAVAEFSDDPQKANNQGDNGWQPDGGYGFLNEQIVANPVGSVFVVKHPNEVGYFIIKVTDKTAASKKYRLALITREINPSDQTLRDIYGKAQAFAANNRTYQEMQATASAEGMQIRPARITAMMQNINDIDNSRNIVQWAFNEKSEIGMVADQVFESDNMFVVVALKDIFKKGYATLDQVRSMIESQVRIDKKAETLMAKAADAMKGATSIDAVATKLGTTVDSVDDATFNSYFFGKFGMEPKMLGVVAASKEGQLAGPVKGAQGVYVSQLLKVNENTPETADMIRATFQQTYLQKARRISSELRNDATIIDQRNKFF
ncbi:MAG: SurA N-terminal domain-containing protein [Bacteroidales bacterium]|nr:SurA N-terminal domain-containing protein [Bacteroidales bacterium]